MPIAFVINEVCRNSCYSVCALTAPGQLPSTSTRNLQLPKPSATPWLSCWITSVLLSGKTSVPCRREGERLLSHQPSSEEKTSIWWNNLQTLLTGKCCLLLWARVQQHPYERFAAPFQVFTWAAPHGEHTLDCVRAEETHASHMGQDKHTAGQVADTN